MPINFKKIITLLLTAFFIAVFFLPETGFAASGIDTVREGLTKSAETGGVSTGDASLATMAGRAINYLFGIVGVIFLTISLVGGYQWMTAGGNDEKVGKAKAWVVNGINGMIVIFLSYALVFAILGALRAAVNGS